MGGVLIYPAAEAVRNRAAIARYLEAFGPELVLLTEEAVLTAVCAAGSGAGPQRAGEECLRPVSPYDFTGGGCCPDLVRCLSLRPASPCDCAGAVGDTAVRQRGGSRLICPCDCAGGISRRSRSPAAPCSACLFDFMARTEMAETDRADGCDLRWLRAALVAAGAPCEPTFALVRAMNPALSAALEAAGLRVFNRAAVSRLCNDKRETYLAAARAGILHVPSVFAYESQVLFLPGTGGTDGAGRNTARGASAPFESTQGSRPAAGRPVSVEKDGVAREENRPARSCGVRSEPSPREDHASACEAALEQALQRFSLPLVVKPARGHGGRGVTLCHTAEEARAAARALLPDVPIFQPPTGEPGVDVRVYLLAGGLFAAMERRGGAGEFRSNFCLGGAARPITPPPALCDAVAAVGQLAAFDYAGADFFCDGERFLLNELEDVVGARMLYAHTALDPIAAFVTHIRREISTG